MEQIKIQDFLKKHRIDIIVVASFLLISLIAILATQITRVGGSYAEVTVDGNTVAKYPLAIDGVYSLNGGTNTLTIKDGIAYMSYSSCPDHTCEHRRAKYVRQTIVCLPNLVTVTIVGDSDDYVDFVS